MDVTFSYLQYPNLSSNGSDYYTTTTNNGRNCDFITANESNDGCGNMSDYYYDYVNDKDTSGKVSDVIDAQTMDIWDISVNCVIIYVICSFGIIGNSLNIVILRHHGFQESTNIVLVSLSISDLIFSVMLPVTKLRCVVGHFDQAMGITVDTFVTVFFYMPKFVCLATSFWNVALIAIERFIAVFFPFQVAKIFRVTVMKCLVVGIFVFSLVAVSPLFFAFTYEWQHDTDLNETVAVVKNTIFYENNYVALNFYMWVALNHLFSSLSILIVLSCCLAIAFRLPRAAIRQKAMASRARGYDVRVVKMLITVCAVYLCVSVPTITMDTYSYFQPNFIFISPIHKIMQDTGDILYAVNASANFLVYVTMSKKFAQTYRRLLHCRKTADDQNIKSFATNASRDFDSPDNTI